MLAESSNRVDVGMLGMLPEVLGGTLIALTGGENDPDVLHDLSEACISSLQKGSNVVGS